MLLEKRPETATDTPSYPYPLSLSLVEETRGRSPRARVVEYFNLEVLLLSMLLPMLAEVRFNRRYRLGLRHLAPDARLQR
jgi:hypothetical protein